MKKLFLALSLMLFAQQMNAMTAWVLVKAALYTYLVYGNTKFTYLFYKQEVKELNALLQEKSKASKESRIFVINKDSYKIEDSIIKRSTVNKVSKNPFLPLSDQELRSVSFATRIIPCVSATIAAISAYNLGSIISNFM